MFSIILLRAICVDERAKVLVVFLFESLTYTCGDAAEICESLSKSFSKHPVFQTDFSHTRRGHEVKERKKLSGSSDSKMGKVFSHQSAWT